MNSPRAHVSSPTPFQGSAAWIWSAEGSHGVPDPSAASPSHYQVRRFRRRFEIPAGEVARARVHVSADSRYVLYCNGRMVGRGPAKGDVNHQFYDTYELDAYLQAGTNVIAALVLDMSRVAHRPHQLGAPCSVMTYTGGFLLEGAVVRADRSEELNTGAEGWLVASELRAAGVPVIVGPVMTRGWRDGEEANASFANAGTT